METPVVEPVAAPTLDSENPAPTNIDTVTKTTDTAAVTTSSTPQTPTKHVHSLVLDANAIIKNDPSVSTLIAQAEELYTIPAVVSESWFSPVREVYPCPNNIDSSRRGDEIQIPNNPPTFPQDPDPQTGIRSVRYLFCPTNRRPAGSLET